MTITRRRFLASSLGAAALVGPFAALGARPASARTAVSPDYGPGGRALRKRHGTAGGVRRGAGSSLLLGA